MLNIMGNVLESQVPRSLANCTLLDILDLGKNKISDTFPFWLGKLPTLRVLVLQSNRFYGSIEHPPTVNEFQMLQIMDLSFNTFTGDLPAEYIGSLMAMMSDNRTEYGHYIRDDPYYRNSMTIMAKGRQVDFASTISILVEALDLSNNRFQGEIPEVIGDLKSLILLNLSRNHLMGQIPSSIGKMSQLESLDLSHNKLSGRIPPHLTNLYFLEVLELSQNSLEGPLPPLLGQFSTFSNSSYIGNLGLCKSPPLSRECRYVAETMVCGTRIGIFYGGSLIVQIKKPIKIFHFSYLLHE
ncbi:hypothetical protein NE237_000217 [Protea cynaroides]|uniref:Uncharacterized protein n=1 Tax=Protea cynaroides TaxID=273540 RepID=A0A9Q0KRT8_9MAGN|nr:hypothetical protein NE237_000217 [Protea cynaroides]